MKEFIAFITGRFKRSSVEETNPPFLWWFPCGPTEKPTPDLHCSCSSAVPTCSLENKKTKHIYSCLRPCSVEIFPLKDKDLGNKHTCLEALDGERRLSQKVLVVEHINFKNPEAQESKGRVADSEGEGLPGPGRVQAVVSWKRPQTLG